MKFFYIFFGCLSMGFATDAFDGLNVSSEASQSVSTSVFGQNSVYIPANLYQVSDLESGQVSSYRWVKKSDIQTMDKDSVSLSGNEELFDVPTSLTSTKPQQLKRAGATKILAVEGEWLKIDLSLLQSVLTIPKFEIAKVNTQSSSLALRPNLQTKNKSKYKWLAKGTSVQILDQQGNWYLVKANDDLGFSYKKYIKKTDRKEEYWHTDAQSDKSKTVALIGRYQEKVDNGSASITERFEYAQALESYLAFAKPNELNSIVMELKSQVNSLIAIKQGTSKELDIVDLAKKFKESQIGSVTREVRLAKDFLKNGNVEKAILYGKIASYKSDFTDIAGLEILKESLEAKNTSGLNAQEIKALDQEKLFVIKLLTEHTNKEVDNIGDEKPDNEKDSDTIVTALSEYDKAIDKDIEKVLKENEKNYLTKGKNKLIELDKSINGKSAKVKYYLAKQYVYLARVYSGKAKNFKSLAKAALEQANKLEGQDLDTYTENNLWAKKATVLLEEGLNKVEDVPVSVTSVNSELQNLPGNKVKLSNYDLNALASIAILEAGAKCQQETLDVAQVVFNRINSKYFKNTMDEVLFRYKAFEPFGPIDGTSGAAKRAGIFNSRDKSLKYIADFRKGIDYRLAKERVETFIGDLKDVTRMKGARNFVGGRAFFLGSNMSYHPSRGDVTRNKQRCNRYKFGLYNDSELRTHKRVKDELVREAPLEVIGE